MTDKDYCMSSCLAFRYITRDGYEWKDGISPKLPLFDISDLMPVSSSQEIYRFLEDYISQNIDDNTCIFLSGGIDSAILASFLPKGTKALSIRFVAEGAIDESIFAKKYCEAYDLEHVVVDVTWEDYLQYAPYLMKRKKAPLHAVEVGLYKAAKTAAQHGKSHIVLGNGADSTFGGMDKLLSRDWSFVDFVERYTFIKPDCALKNPISMGHVYEPYRIGEGINFVSFLKEVHGLGIIQAFDNALCLAGCEAIEPFEHLRLAVPLDMERIRSGESKYFLREIFKSRYPALELPAKIPFARPMDQWLKAWKGPERSEWRDDLDVSKFTGDQKWIMYSLETFLNLMEI